MASTPMELDEPSSAPAPSLNVTRTLGGGNVPSTSSVSDIISSLRPTKLFRRDDVKEGRPKPHVLSIDFDDPGDLCMTSESDETIRIYNVKEGRHDKSLVSKKYGVKLAKFTHTSSSILYASTKQNDAIRYLATHDNSFIRYFEGHEASVTDIAVHPGTDNFISCGRDDTAYLWNISTSQWVGKLFLNTPYLAAWDPSGNVFGIACPASAAVLLFDYRNFTKAPFATFDISQPVGSSALDNPMTSWTKLEFSNDGKHILVGTKGSYHLLLDSFDGSLKGYLRKPEGGTRRAAAGEDVVNQNGNAAANPEAFQRFESSGDCSFTPDGRYVLSGSKKDLLVWDTLGPANSHKVLEPAYVLEEKTEAAVLGFNPRYNMLATADQELMFWLPDPHA